MPVRLADIDRANSLMIKRRDLQSDIHHATNGGLSVTIQGRYQDATMLGAVRDAVIGEFNRRIAEIDAELQALGVEV